ncbi:MAG: carboxymuconolactone decarboxylase family protein [Motiliproteus sp.]
MKPYKIYVAETATPPTDNLLYAVEDMIGFVPNIFAVLAESEASLRAFIQLNQQLGESSFDATEREIIQTAASVENQCGYCVAGHTAFANIQEVDSKIIDAVRNNQAIKQPKLESLNQFTRLMVNSKGSINNQQLNDFFSAGYTPANALEVILGICVKIFSNYAGNMIGIPLDDQFSRYEWYEAQTQETA